MQEASLETKIRVLLADDHALVRQGFRRMLEDNVRIAVVAEASTGLEAIEQYTALKPDVVVMDISMPEIGGLEATAEILKQVPGARIIILSMHDNPAYIRKAIEVGARGYILKGAIETDLAQAILTVARGEAFLSPSVSSVVLESWKGGGVAGPGQDPYDLLTLREKEVLQLVAQGKSNKEIATLLDISANTVAVHRAHLMDTLGLHRTAEVVLYAVKRGLIQPL